MQASIADALARMALVLPPSHPAILILIKVTLLLLIALAVTEGLARSSAGSRHLIWLLALAGLVAIPAIGRWAKLPIPMLPAIAQPVESIAPRESVAAPLVGEGTPSPTTPEPHPPTTVPAEAAVFGIGAILLAVWALAGLALMARIVLSALAVRRVIRRATVLEDPSWQTPLWEIADRLGLDAAPRLLQSDEARMPFAAGLANTVIVLPKDSESWSPERRTAVLIHELGHVRRRDLIGHTLSRVACAVYWFHPLVWTAARKLRAESERACDDLAIQFGARPSEYAEHLLDIVTCVRDHRTPAIALAMAHRKEFEGRMLAILNPDLSRSGPNRRETLAAVTSLTVVALLVGAAAPVPRPAQASTSEPTEAQSLVETPAPAPSDSGERRLPTTGGVEAPSPLDDGAKELALDAPAAAESLTLTLQTPTSTLTIQAQDPEERAAALARALRSDLSARVRRTAAWGLQRYVHLGVAADALASAVQSDQDPEVRETAAWAMADARRGSSAAAALLVAFRRDKYAAVRATAGWALVSIGDPVAADAMLDALTDTAPSVRELAAWGVGHLSLSQAPVRLVALLRDDDPSVRLAAAWALHTIADPATASDIEAAFRQERNREVRLALIRTLGALGDVAVDVFEELITSPDDQVRAMAVTALAGGQVSGPWPWPRPMPRPYP